MGSIGVYVVVYDYSKLLEAEGVRAIKVSSGGIKGEGAFGLPVSEEYEAALAVEIEAYAKQFDAAIARGRGISIDDARALRDGRCYVGDAALEVGLVDGIRSLRALVAELTGEESAQLAVPSPEQHDDEEDEPMARTENAASVPPRKFHAITDSGGVGGTRLGIWRSWSIGKAWQGLRCEHGCIDESRSGVPRACEVAAVQSTPFELREPRFHGIEPGSAGWREVQVEAGVLLEPVVDGLGAVGAGIVKDEMQVEIGIGRSVDLAQECKKLLGSMPLGDSADDVA